MHIFATLLAFLSGASALTHQIVWTRRFVDTLGADANTFSKVVGAFFVGLALGAGFAPRFLPGVKAWTRVALAEVLVAVLALPPLFSHTFAPGPSGVWKLLLPVLLISPAAFAMGLFLPLLFMAFALKRSRLYAANIAGGVVGVFGALMFLLPRMETTHTGLIAISLNLLIAFSAILLRNRVSPVGHSPAVETHSTTISVRTLVLLAFGSGYAVLASEVVLQQQFAQVTINSIFSSGFVLAAVLVSLALAAALVPALLRNGKIHGILAAVLFTSALLCFLEPFQLIALRPNLEMLPYELRLPRYVVEMIRLAVFSVCPLLLVAGLLFPLLLHVAPMRRLALLLAWNGVGGWLGAEITHAFMLPGFGLWSSMAAIGGIYVCLLLSIKSRWHFPAVAGAALIVTLFAARSLPQVSTRSPERLARVEVGREGVVATVRAGTNDWRMLFNNSYTLGGSKAQFNQERQALLPLLLHGNPNDVACLGVATGSTIAGATLHPQAEHIDAIELSPLVLDQARAFFIPFNRNVFSNPRVRFIQEDARWIMASGGPTYDVVIGDLFLPWRTGEGRLFTLEHFKNVRDRLKPGGVFCQWLPMFQLTRAQFDAIARTFERIFPGTWVLRCDFYAELPIIGLFGGKNLSNVDWALVEQVSARVRDSGEVTDPLMRHSAGIAMMIVGPLADVPPGPVNTLENGWLEWDAGRNIIGMREPWFVGVPCAEYIRSLHRRGQVLLAPEVREAHDAGQFFLTLEIAARLRLPALTGLQLQIPSRMPPALWRDNGAAWENWPMRIKPNPPH